MSKRTRRAPRYGAGEETAANVRRPAEPTGQSSDVVSVLFGIAGTLFGLSLGYVIATQLAREPFADRPAAITANVGAPADGASPALADEEELRALRDLVARDPTNLAANVTLGNRLYDAGRFAEAVPYYRAAFELDPDDVNVSTDLGTALFYSGRPEAALAQYERSLAIDASHAQTLLNIGIVALEGLRDPQRAIDSWQQLLAAHPTFPERARVEDLLAQARRAL